jgi:hypothetical protein
MGGAILSHTPSWRGSYSWAQVRGGEVRNQSLHIFAKRYTYIYIANLNSKN